VSTSVSLPNTIQIRPSRLTGLVVGVAILTGVTTWSVSQVTRESHTSSTTKSAFASSQATATKTYVDGVIALDPEHRAAIFGNVSPAQPSVWSVNAATPELQAVGVDQNAIAKWARAEGLTGLSPASLRSPTPPSVRSVNAASPELQTVDASPTQPYPDAIAAVPRARLIALLGTLR
jgi:hypothetical protein